MRISGSSAGSTRASPSRPAASRAWPPARARDSASASSSTGRGASPAATACTAEESTASPARPSGSPGPRRPPCATRRCSPTGRPPPARYETPVVEDPFEIPLERKIARPAGRRPGRQPRQGHRLHRVDVRGPARVEDVRGDRRHASPSRSSPTSAPPSRPTPSTATSTSGAPTRIPAAAGTPAATSSSARSTSPTGPSRWPTRRWRCSAPRSARPAGSRSSSTRASSTCRSTRAAATRPSSTGSTAPRRRYAGTSFLTTDKLDEGFRYGSDVIDIVADATAPGGMGTFGWDDEGVAAQSVPLVQNGIFVGYLTQPRDRDEDRPGQRRGDARRRLEPHPAHPHDQHQPAAEARA